MNSLKRPPFYYHLHRQHPFLLSIVYLADFFLFVLFVFSSPEPPAQDDLLWSYTVRRPSFRPSTPLNNFSSETLGKISSNFMWSLLLKGDWNSLQMVTVRKSRWPPCPYIVKPLRNLLLQNRESFGAKYWYKAFGAQGLPSWSKWWP